MRSHALALIVALAVAVAFIAAATMLLPIATTLAPTLATMLSPGGPPARRIASVAPASTFTVNSTGDEADSVAGDGVCRTSAGACTLRAAIEEANAREGADAIHFSIGSGARTIAPKSPLPVVFEEVVIDGTTQPGYAGSPLIEIDGGSIEAGDVREGPGIDGLVLVNGSITVRGLAISGFGGAGLVLTEGDGNRVEGCWIGTGTSGVEDKGNGGDGIVLLRSSDNVIGGVEARQRNLIAGNDGRGILIGDAASSGNIVQGNIIGIAADGSARPNGSQGILILGAPDNEIGGAVPAAGNVIAGNKGNGIEISGSSASGNRVEGNLVGARGADDPGNGGTGIVVDGAPKNVIGGAPAARNWVAGNGGDGIAILGGDARGNRVAGNLIGIASDGEVPRGNDGDGILIAGAPGNTIGGPVSAVLLSTLRATSATTDTHAGNVIGHSSGDGIEISGTGARANRIIGNRIGIDAAGGPAGNRANGIFVTDAPDNIIGGDAGRDEGNAIGASARNGIAIVGIGATGNRIEGNTIGTLPWSGGPRDPTYDATGALSNAGEGVLILGAPANRIGAPSDPKRIGIPPAPGTSPPSERGNVIAGNAGDGVRIAGDGADGNTVEWNAIGILGGFEGNLRVGNGGDGVAIIGGARTNVVRGSTIVASAGHGVSVTGAGTDRNIVSGNRVGADEVAGNGAEGADASGDGVLVRAGAARNEVSDNAIQANLRHGIHIHGTGTEGNVALDNRISAPGGAGIRVAAGASANRVGGVAPDEAPDAWSNHIEAHAEGGIVIAHADDNRILWNAVLGPSDGAGTGAPVAPVAPPAPPEPAAGIVIEGARNAIGPGNLVGRQRGDGIALVGISTADNRLFGNWIGGGVGPDAAGNGGSGVRISGSATGNLVGTTAEITSTLVVARPGPRPPLGNVIANNAGDGVRIESGARNAVSANHIFENSGMAIDLGGDGRGAGDPGDSDAANRGQPAPEWHTAHARADSVQGAASGRPGRALRLELFASRRCRPDGEGDAEWPLARVDVTVGADGRGSFDLDLTPLLEPDPSRFIGRALSATATDLEGNTSEVAPCVPLLVPQVYLPKAAR